MSRFESSNCRFSQIAPHPAAIWTYCIPRRANLLPLVLFRFGYSAVLCRTVWRSVLQNNWHLTYAASHDEGAADRGEHREVAEAPNVIRGNFYVRFRG